VQRGTGAPGEDEIHLSHRGGARGGNDAREQIDIHVSHLASRQRGLVTTGQLLDAGLTYRAIALRAAAGRYHRVHRGVYAVGHTALPAFWVEQAALLACGVMAVLSHRSAAVIWCLLHPNDGPVDVTLPPPHRRGRSGIRLHRVTDAPETARREGLPVTTVARTLADLRGPDLDRALNEALVKRLIRPGDLPDTPAIRALLADGLTPTRSPPERRLLELIKDAGLPRPCTNAPLGPYEVDLLFPDQRLVVEVDGFAAHGTRRAFERDRARDADLAAAGYVVLRFTARQIEHAPATVVARLAAALATARTSRAA
jgi:very-short-patch-repair endonuclease